jgi:hypothetical protein
MIALTNDANSVAGSLGEPRYFGNPEKVWVRRTNALSTDASRVQRCTGISGFRALLHNEVSSCICKLEWAGLCVLSSSKTGGIDRP